MKRKQEPTLEDFRQIYSRRLSNALEKAGIDLAARNGREAYVQAMKALIQEGREKLREAHLSGASGTEVVYRITAWTDAVLNELFDASRRISGLENEVPCTLLAIGGYGRGELNPFSDLDIMFLTENEIDPVSRSFSETCLYLMWDLGLDIGHSIRTLNDCVDLAASDIKAKTSLIESRFLAGRTEVYSRFQKVSYQKILRRGRDAYLRTKIADVNDRNKKFGGSLYLKEPQIKEGVGGLRDIHTAFWIAKVKYGVNSLGELKQMGVVSDKEDRILRHSLRFLWKVRNHLHYLSGRRNDLLTMDLQEKTAAFLNFKDLKHYLAVERFMRAYYLQTRNIRYFTTLIMNRCAPTGGGRKFPGLSFRSRKVGGGLSLIGNTLCVPEDREDYFREEPSRLMEIFALSQRYDVPLADATKQKVFASLALVDETFCRSAQVHQALLRILGWKKNVVKTLRQMHELRFLGRYIREFGAVTALVQHELYHTYTVDEHTLFALKKLEGLRGSPYPGERFYARLFQNVEKPELLYLALLLHDVGKAMGPGHVERGGQAVPAIMDRIGFNGEDAKTVEFLVRNHLVMAHLSQRRDIHDPKLIADFAKTVGRENLLNMLTLVTYCDTRAVGPGIWNDWKDTLLKELYQKTLKELDSGPECGVKAPGLSRLDRIRERVLSDGSRILGEESMAHLLKTLPAPYLLITSHRKILKHLAMVRRVDKEGVVIEWDHSPSQDYTELDICTYDSDTPGLFSKITGVLASRRINIFGARLFTSYEGLVIDSLHVEAPDEKRRADSGLWQDVAASMRSVIEGTRQVKELLVAHETPTYLKKKKGRKIQTRAHFDNRISDTCTVIDVYAEDRIGLLYSITSCLKALGVHIHSSKITTEADRAIDAFYVTDIFGHKITGEDKLQRIQEALVERLHRPGKKKTQEDHE